MCDFIVFYRADDVMKFNLSFQRLQIWCLQLLVE